MISLPVRVPERYVPHPTSSNRARLIAAARREWLPIAAVGSAVFAVVTALISVNQPERLWGLCAAGGYGVAAVTAVVLRYRGPVVAVTVGLTGAVLVPLGWMISAGLAQPEVGVVSHGASMFLHHGTPYLGPAALAAAHNVNAYDPYLPALIMFGMPRALLGSGLVTDPRVWFGLGFLLTFVTAAAVAGARRPGWCAVVVIASPVVALPLSVGGDDLPVLGLMCLGLAVAARDDLGRWRPLAAGLIIGLAAAMKATAWPALAMALVFVIAQQGRRAVAPYLAAALAVAVAADGATLAAHPSAAWTNTVLFPLGLAQMRSPAASALPGHLIASTWSAGHTADLALIATAALAFGIWLIVRPPRSLQAAGWRLVLGLTVLFLLAPASRVGYFTYPCGVAAWLLILRAGDEPAPQEPEPVEVEVGATR
jgi:glycosyl transferase family 87